MPARNRLRLIELMKQLGIDHTTNEGIHQAAELFGFDDRTIRRWLSTSASASNVPPCAIKLAEVLVQQKRDQYLVFAWEKTPQGGWKDFRAGFRSLDDALKSLKTKPVPTSQFHIVRCTPELRSFEILGA